MKKYILRYALTFFSGRIKVGHIEFLAENLESARSKSFEVLYECLKEKSINNGDNELYYFENLKSLKIVVAENNDQ
ncbi:hypothetical protein LXD69_07180 [Flavobacterium sediminilitoris]|uniref:Uncharacterized protein n=1 Tax=Flavobacterium sediminilitoris TaxID=2024526 RepID=A0ABY4HQY9_9FLAO|nr:MULTISPECIES: hypothetical protein [Flavobacterium]UOX35293.1 hypothetical protein LXD69_07180 [Flavobacterium sediminilitoris]